MPVEVREAGPADAEALTPLIHAHAAFEKGTATVTASALRAALTGGRPSLKAWLAENEGAPIGYATATLDFSTWSGAPYLHMDCLFVSASHRGRGVGAQLLAAVRAFAAAGQIGEVQWQTPSWNEAAARFYNREGARASLKLRFTLPA